MGVMGGARISEVYMEGSAWTCDFWGVCELATRAGNVGLQQQLFYWPPGSRYVRM